MSFSDLRIPISLSTFVLGVGLGALAVALAIVPPERELAPRTLELETSPLLEPVSGVAVPEPPFLEPVAETSDHERPLSGDGEAPPAALIAQRAVDFAVSIQTSSHYGTGTLVGDGVVLTALHVVAGQRGVEVRFRDGAWIDAEMIASDATADLALLRVDSAGHEPAPLASGLGVRAADLVLGVGNPRELSFTVHRGSVSFVGRRFAGVRYLQTDLPANPGSSGGPLVNEHGHVIGVISFVLHESEGLTFATPVDYALEMLRSAGIRSESLTASAGAFDAWRGGAPR